MVDSLFSNVIVEVHRVDALLTSFLQLLLDLLDKG